MKSPHTSPAALFCAVTGTRGAALVMGPVPRSSSRSTLEDPLPAPGLLNLGAGLGGAAMMDPPLAPEGGGGKAPPPPNPPGGGMRVPPALPGGGGRRPAVLRGLGRDLPDGSPFLFCGTKVRQVEI